MTDDTPTEKRNAVSTALGKSLKAIRIAANKSQETLAFEAEVDRTFISLIERGLANPSVLTLANICFALNTTMAELFAGVNSSVPASSHIRRSNRAQPSLKPVKSRLR
ncbi:helix-turn-helix domain-containing protein [Duganella radicis]|uniref:Helix-turn-helix domain-containing protein n=1 Tax=Duganella radicis TaxID=551988 RepID=A0A6L6PGC6_9BURK|nr:helix-turn-helix transcriptional regulator [Duganella radicis]MTV38043.1 helix-turn-helix domain-containing protein [Duganella radicis]